MIFRKLFQVNVFILFITQVKVFEEKSTCEGPSVKLIADLESPSSTRDKTSNQTVCSSPLEVMVDSESTTGDRLEKLTKYDFYFKLICQR